MSTLREAAQQALEALEDMIGWQSLAPQMIQESAKGRAYALRAALAEPVQEQPVCDECGKSKHDGWALYCVGCVEPMFAPSKPKDSKHAEGKA